MLNLTYAYAALRQLQKCQYAFDLVTIEVETFQTTFIGVNSQEDKTFRYQFDKDGISKGLVDITDSPITRRSHTRLVAPLLNLFYDASAEANRIIVITSNVGTSQASLEIQYRDEEFIVKHDDPMLRWYNKPRYAVRTGIDKPDLIQIIKEFSL